MKVNEMVFFDRLKNIKKRLDDAYMYDRLVQYPKKMTLELYRSQSSRFFQALEAVGEARDDLDLLLSLTMEDPQHIALQGQHSLKKDALYELLDINKPMPRPPIGAVTVSLVGHPVAVEAEEAEG